MHHITGNNALSDVDPVGRRSVSRVTCGVGQKDGDQGHVISKPQKDGRIPVSHPPSDAQLSVIEKESHAISYF